jgi:hypothetical protein
VAQLADARRQFTLTPEEFALLNPNTRTCPVFRSQRDAELTKKLYRAAPVLIREEVKNEAGEVIAPEVNPWGIRFQRMMDMANDSGLFLTDPAQSAEPTLPLYEAKMIHQFDHRWASYAPGTDESGAQEVRAAHKADPAYTVQPRYWVDAREVLARIARVPRPVAKVWLALHQAQDAADRDDAQQALWLALAAWVAGELFRREAGPPPAAGYADGAALRGAQQAQRRIAADYPACAAALAAARITGKKAVAEFAKWARQDVETPLSDDDLATLRRLAGEAPGETRERALLATLDAWMDAKSPRWLMGWRDICRATDERTVIASVVPRVGLGDKFLLMFPTQPPELIAALLGNLNSISFDYVARQKVGGTSLKYFTMKQLVAIPPDRYTAADLDFIVPRVLELTYTAWDLRPWAQDLGFDGPPFAFDPDRRAMLRAELDAYYARLYGLTENELRYILDPAEVEGPDYPSETFRVLKEGELRAFGEYRTRRLVLEAWRALQAEARR